MVEPQCSSILSVEEANWLMQVDNSVSKKDLSNTRRLFYLLWKSDLVGWHTSRGRFFYPERKFLYVLIMLLFAQGCLDFSYVFGDGGVVSAFLNWSAVTWPMNFVDFCWHRTHFSWASSSGGRVCLHSRRILSGFLQEAVNFLLRKCMIDSTCIRCVIESNSNCSLRSIGIVVW